MVTNASRHQILNPLAGLRFRHLPHILAGVLLATAAVCAPALETVDVPMDDGVTLVTDIFTPVDGGPAWPVLLERSVYPRPAKGDAWTKLGVVYVVQSVRGRFGSGGEFKPFADDGWTGHRDGVTTVNWILDQPWCNGTIGTVGTSATGISTALLGPATTKLACQVFMDTSADVAGCMVYQGGVFRKSLAEGWLQHGVQCAEYAQVWKGEPPLGDYWRPYDAIAMAADTTSPGLHVGGWWDIFARSTVEHFMARQYRGGPGAKGTQTLVMRPTVHGDWGEQDLKLPDNFDDFRVTPFRKDFVKRWLFGEVAGIAGAPAVHYYIVGDDTDFDGPGWEWRTATDWPPFPTKDYVLYLAPDGLLATTAPDTEGSRTYTFDPRDPVPTVGGQNLLLPAGPKDQRAVGDRSDVLKFVSAPLAAPMEATGHFTATLFVSTSAPDTDFTAKLVDVYPDGREILMLDGIQRLKYRNGVSPLPPVAPGDVVELTVDLGHISWVFNTGHRVGVQVSSSNYPRFAVNPNTGDDFVADESSMRPAENTVYLGGAHTSCLVLPAPAKTASDLATTP